MALNPSQLYQALQAVLEPMGFEKDPDVIAAIGFRGDVAGRLVRVSAAVRSRHIFTGVDNTSVRVNTGVMISVTTETPISTRLTVGIPRLGWLATRVFLPRLGLSPVPKRVDGMEIWASEQDWARRFLDSKAFVELVSRGPDLSACALVFTPEKATLSFAPRTEQLEADTIGQWLGLIVGLAAAAESDPPSIHAQRTWLERQSKGTQVAIIVGALFGIPLLLLGMFGFFLLAIIFLVAL